MPIMKFKKPPKLKKGEYPIEQEERLGPEYGYPTIDLKVSDEILDSVQTDDEVTITLKGRISGIESCKNDYYERQEISIEVMEYSIGDDSYEGLEDAD